MGERVGGELDNNGTPSPSAVFGKVFTIAEVIQKYRDMRESSRPINDSSTEHYTLKNLEQHLGHIDATKITPQDLVGYCEARKDSDRPAGQYTLNMEASKLGTVMRYTAALLHLSLPDVTAQARPLLSHLGLIGAGKRERRPTEDELHFIIKTLEEYYGKIYADDVRFAVATARRGLER